jgi:hypothetical protein
MTGNARAAALAAVDPLEHGLVRPSFILPEPFRALRDLTRYRRVVIEERARESQRLHKVLEDAGVKLSSVASSVLTKPGREMIDAFIAGQRDAEMLAEMAKGRMRAKIPQLQSLQSALAGRFNEHHALLCQVMLARIDQADASVAALTGRIDELLDPYEAAVSLLVTIRGVARRSARRSSPSTPERTGLGATTSRAFRPASVGTAGGADAQGVKREIGGDSPAGTAPCSKPIRSWPLTTTGSAPRAVPGNRASSTPFDARYAATPALSSPTTTMPFTASGAVTAPGRSQRTAPVGGS